MSAALAEPTDDAADWLRHLYAQIDAGWISLLSADRTTGEKAVDWRPVSDLDGLAHIAAKRTEQSCVWFGVATRRQQLGNRRGSASDCLVIPALWLDVDIAGPNHAAATLPETVDEAMTLIARFPLEPTAIVHTGGGLQPWWMLDEPVDAEEAAEWLKRWGATWARMSDELGWSLDNVFDVARVMRLPGTVNRKNEPTPVTVISADWSRRYGLDQIEDHLDALPEPAPVPAEPRVPYIGPDRPGDAFKAQNSVRDVLARLGFHSPRRLGNGDEDWTRPGKEARHGASARWYADDDYVTIYSATCQAMWPALKIRRPYDALGLFADTIGAGDWRATISELRAKGYGSPLPPDDLSWVNFEEPTATTSEEPDTMPTPVDWHALFAREITYEWLVEDFWPRGRQLHIFAARKTGKSLVMLWIAANLAAGRDPFTGQPTEPIVVIYMDYEMSEEDLLERVEDMGFTPDVLENLRYYLHPMIAPLDTAEGGQELLALIGRDQAQAVVLDTVSRIVEGEENSSDTFRALFRHTGAKLKALGVSLARLDHEGHEAGRSRGSSAKADDVDVVWRLSVADDGGYTLSRKAARIAWVPETVDLSTTQEPLSFSRAAGNWPAGTRDVADKLDSLGAPLDISRRAASTLLRENYGAAGRNEIVSKALSHRKQAALRDDWIGPQSGTTAGTTQKRTPFEDPGATRGPQQETPSDLRGPSRGPVGTTIPGSKGGSPPPLGGDHPTPADSTEKLSTDQPDPEPGSRLI